MDTDIDRVLFLPTKDTKGARSFYTGFVWLMVDRPLRRASWTCAEELSYLWGCASVVGLFLTTDEHRWAPILIGLCFLPTKGTKGARSFYTGFVWLMVDRPLRWVIWRWAESMVPPYCIARALFGWIDVESPWLQPSPRL